MTTKSIKKGDILYQIHMGQIVKGTVYKIYDNAVTLKIKDLCLSQEYTYLVCNNWYLTLKETIQDFIDHTNKEFNTDFKILEENHNEQI